MFFVCFQNNLSGLDAKPKVEFWEGYNIEAENRRFEVLFG